MTTKLIGALIIALVLLGCWGLWHYWDRFEENQRQAEREAAAKIVHPEQLPGLPQELQASLDAAQKQGTAGMKAWLAAYDRFVQDPRKAWIELDYCVMLSSDDPNEARRIFAEVKKRTPSTSPVWPRIKELEKSYE